MTQERPLSWKELFRLWSKKLLLADDTNYQLETFHASFTISKTSSSSSVESLVDLLTVSTSVKANWREKQRDTRKTTGITSMLLLFLGRRCLLIIRARHRCLRRVSKPFIMSTECKAGKFCVIALSRWILKAEANRKQRSSKKDTKRSKIVIKKRRFRISPSMFSLLSFSGPRFTFFLLPRSFFCIQLMPFTARQPEEMKLKTEKRKRFRSIARTNVQEPFMLFNCSTFASTWINWKRKLLFRSYWEKSNNESYAESGVRKNIRIAN